jgi:hypothetical protein
MLVLSQFVLRLSFGLAAAMALISSRKVTGGYFRNHAYVLLGLNVLATLAALADRNHLWLWPPLVAALLSYVCAAVWLYEKPTAGKLMLWSIAAVSLVGILPASIPVSSMYTQAGMILWRLDAPTSGLVLGSTIAAMFLGHWYLNTPTMELAPLRGLLILMVIAVLLRAAVSGAGLFLQASETGLSSTQWLLVGLRWIAGIFGTAGLIAMAWQTLKIPNTQSATGILYVAVITTFLGELISLLLSAGTGFPL